MRGSAMGVLLDGYVRIIMGRRYPTIGAMIRQVCREGWQLVVPECPAVVRCAPGLTRNQRRIEHSPPLGDLPAAADQPSQRVGVGVVGEARGHARQRTYAFVASGKISQESPR